jgi:hypothetical protein
MVTPFEVKSTVPPGVPDPGEFAATVAVYVTLASIEAGLAEGTTLIVVAAFETVIEDVAEFAP